MCRLYGFRSQVLSGVHQSLLAADNALARQSLEHPDGWGVAYYPGRFPHVIRSDKQALEDGLFRDVSAVVATRSLLAHIRQATVGGLGVLNCHPFQHGPWTFAHNGEIAGFNKDADLRSRVMEGVDEYLRPNILGTTDSEPIFYLFLSQLSRRIGDVHAAVPDTTQVVDAVRATVDRVLALSDRRGEEETLLTWIATNGTLMVGHRLRRPLYYSTYKTLCPERDECPAYEPALCEAPVLGGVVKHMILTSEKVRENPNVWTELRDGEIACVDRAMHFSIRRSAV